MYEETGLTKRVALCGSPEQCAESLMELIDAGADYVVLNPLYGHMAQLDALARVTELVRSK